MWNPSQSDVAEIIALKKASPVAAKHLDELMRHLEVQARKLAYYEKMASPQMMAKAAEAGFAGMSERERAVYMTKAAGSERGVIGEGFRLVPEPTPADRDRLAKRADVLPRATTTRDAGGMSVSPQVLAAIAGGRSADFRPAGMAKGF